MSVNGRNAQFCQTSPAARHAQSYFDRVALVCYQSRPSLSVQICIHRGAQEIGGSCVEVENEGSRLILDLGLPLEAELGQQVAIPDVKGLGEGDSAIVGLILSHGHPDHYGLEKSVHPSVPRYLGQATQSILQKASFFTRNGAEIAAAGYLEDRQPLRIGPFTVTPYLVDHSAFDAYAVLVEAGGRRIIYSSDLRAHGRKALLFERLVADPPPDIDVLLLEGTNIQPRYNLHCSSERDVEERCAQIFSKTEGMVLACYSAQNIDRLVTLFRATKRTGRTLVLDLYGAKIARATGRPRFPKPSGRASAFSCLFTSGLRSNKRNRSTWWIHCGRTDFSRTSYLSARANSSPRFEVR